MLAQVVSWLQFNNVTQFPSATRTLLIPLTLLFPDVKFMLLHNLKNEDSIKNFFVDVHEFYLKVGMDPNPPQCAHYSRTNNASYHRF